jgi:hypothetical protein
MWHVRFKHNFFFHMDFINLSHYYSRPMALGLTQPLTEMSTWNFHGREARQARKADNLTSICDPIV